MKRKIMAMLLAAVTLLSLATTASAVEEWNVAYGKEAWAATEYTPSNYGIAAHATDGEWSSMYINGGMPASGPQFIAVDLGGYYQLTRLEWCGRDFNHGTAEEPNFAEQRDVKIQLSNDRNFQNEAVTVDLTSFEDTRGGMGWGYSMQSLDVTVEGKYRYIRFVKDEASENPANLCLGELWAYTTDEEYVQPQLRNIAIGGSAWAGSQYVVEGLSADASKAIDGDGGTFFCNGGPVAGGQYWAVDFGAAYEIDEIRFVGRNFTEAEQKDFKIQLSNSRTFATYVDVTSYEDYRTWYTTEQVIPVFDTTKYRYLRFVKDPDSLTRDSISLSEVTVLSPDAEYIQPPLRNISLGKQAWAGSQYVVEGFSADASKAVDGNGATFYCNGGPVDGGQYWTVDFGAAYEIDEIRFSGRNFSEVEQKDFKIMVSNDSSFATSVDLTSYEEYRTWYTSEQVIEVYDTNKYRYLRFQKDPASEAPAVLGLSEVMVLSPDEFKTTNFKVTSQATPVTCENEFPGTLHDQYGFSWTVDGSSPRQYNMCFVSGTGTSSITLDLGEASANYDIQEVKFDVTDRDSVPYGEILQNPTGNFRVYLSNDPSFEDYVQIYNNTLTTADSLTYGIPTVDSVNLTEGGVVYTVEDGAVNKEIVELDDVNTYRYVRFEGDELMRIWEVEVYASDINDSIPAVKAEFYTDATCEVETATIPADGTFAYKLTGMNLDNKNSRDFRVIVAGYEGGKLTGVQMFDHNVAAYATADFVQAVTVTKGNDYKVFVWDKATFEPLTADYDIR